MHTACGYVKRIFIGMGELVSEVMALKTKPPGDTKTIEGMYCLWKRGGITVGVKRQHGGIILNKSRLNNARRTTKNLLKGDQPISKGRLKLQKVLDAVRHPLPVHLRSPPFHLEQRWVCK